VFELVRKNRNRSILLVMLMMSLLSGIGWVAGEMIQPAPVRPASPLLWWLAS